MVCWGLVVMLVVGLVELCGPQLARAGQHDDPPACLIRPCLSEPQEDPVTRAREDRTRRTLEDLRLRLEDLERAHPARGVQLPDLPKPATR